MKELSELLNNVVSKKGLLKSPRNLMLEEIYKLVNTQRKSEYYKPLPIKVYAIKTAHLGTDDLDFLIKQMRKSDSPAKVFFGSLKVKTLTKLDAVVQ